MTSTTTMTQQSPIDIEGTIERLGIERQQAMELFQMAVDEFPITRNTLLECVTDVASLRQHVHRLLGTTSYCQLPFVDKAAREVQAACHSGNTTALPVMVGNLCAEMDRVLQYYNKHIAESS